MIRYVAATFIVFNSLNCFAQTIVRPGQPIGVVQKPMLPLLGSPLQHPTAVRVNQLVTPAINPFAFGWFAPGWVDWYDEPLPRFTIVAPAPQPPAAAVAPPEAPADPRARLTLRLPSGSRVWLAGNEVDAAAIPLILESPVLRDGQAYAFDVKITWRESGRTEERTRQVRVDAGESKSLTYTAGK